MYVVHIFPFIVMPLYCWFTYVVVHISQLRKQAEQKSLVCTHAYLYLFWHTVMVCSANFEVNDDGQIQGNCKKVTPHYVEVVELLK